MSIRIYALARGHDLASKDVVDVCKDLSIEVKNHMSSISEADAARVVQALKGGGGPRPAAVKKPDSAPIEGDPSQIEVLRREDYIPASGVAKKADETAGQPEPKRAEGGERKTGPGSRSRPKPTVVGMDTPPLVVPTATDKTPEPEVDDQEKVQKPQMRLSPNALRGSWGQQQPKPGQADDAKTGGRSSTGASRPKPSTATPTPAPPPPSPKDKPSKKQPKAAGRDKEPEDPAGRPGAVAGREERQKRRGRRAQERRVEGGSEEETETRVSRVRQRMRTRRNASPQQLERPTSIELEPPITVRSLSQACGIRAQELIRKLFDMGCMLNVNSNLDEDLAQMLGLEFGVELSMKREQTAEDEFMIQIESDDDPADLHPRPPVITFLGHVDHGKTSLLDYIRKANVVTGESGGITQHIGAYQVKRDEGPLTFLDTPGHQAFTSMRARGAQLTDIAVLVVAAEDGVMPQTEEAISHAKEAGVPVVVAVNKSDLPNGNPQRVMQQLSGYGLMPVEWGGETEFVNTSALTGAGMDELLETLGLVAELRDLKANPTRMGSGTCLEAALHGQRGVMATLLVQEGTLRRDDLVVCGQAHGRVRAMFDENDQPVEEAGPSTPVSVAGFDCVPGAGEKFMVMEDLDKAREVVETRRERQRDADLSEKSHISLENLFRRMEEEEVAELKMIIRADVRGSLEAIAKELEKLKHPEVSIRILQSSVGGITEGDVLLADTSDAIIVGFRVVPDERARSLAEETGVEIRRYDVIYKLTDEIRESLEGLLKPELKEVELGRVLVQQMFKISKVGSIAGCRVLHGTIEREGKARIVRDGRIIYPVPGSGKVVGIDSLKRNKDDVKEVRMGFECGMKVEGYDDVKEGDIIEVYKIEKLQRTL